MGIYRTIYYNLCETRKSNIINYGYRSGLHKHHIIPKHSGGSDEPDNFTYLTVREHIIAHFLLWKIHNNSNDLRSMNMLGANLTFQQRQAIGIFCKENGIGIWSPNYTKKQRKEAAKKGTKTMQDNKIGIFDPVKKSEYSRKTAKAMVESGQISQEWKFWASPEGRRIRSSRGGKAIKGYKYMYKGEHHIKIPPSKIQEYLDNGYVFGMKKKSKPNIIVGSKSMYNPETNVYRTIAPDKIQEFLDNGYVFGSPKRTRKNKK